MKKTEIMQVRLSPEKKRLYETRARELGLSLTKFAEESADVWAGMAMEFHTLIQAASAKLNISESLLVTMILADWMARKVAEAERDNRGMIFDEVVASEAGFLTGKPLFDERLKRHRANELMEREQLHQIGLAVYDRLKEDVRRQVSGSKKSFQREPKVRINPSFIERWMEEIDQSVARRMTGDPPTVGRHQPESDR